VIERWLQISCDNEDCDGTDNSTYPNQTVKSYRAEKREHAWVYRRGKDFCSVECARAEGK
jgi:hypothetical protein